MSAQHQPVVSYSFAYPQLPEAPRAVALCAGHGAFPPAWLPTLGPVQKGQHQGSCDVCCGATNEGMRASFDAADSRRKVQS